MTHPEQRFLVLKKPTKQPNIFVQPLKDPSSYNIRLFIRRVREIAFRGQEDKNTVTCIDSFEDSVRLLKRGSKGCEVSE
jgi:hypothetical protein